MSIAALVALSLLAQVPDASAESVQTPSPMEIISQGLTTGETQGDAFAGAVSTLQASANAGDVEAMNIMGVLTQRGLASSSRSSEEWYRAAMAADDGAAGQAAQINLALELYSSEGRASEARALLEALDNPADHLRGMHQGYLGYDYLVGIGGDQNTELGRAYLNGAIASGFENAFVFEEYATFWLNPPEGVDMRPDRADEMLRRAVQAGSVNAAWRLGMLILQTNGAPSEAYRFVEWASDQGHEQATISRAVMLAVGQGVEPDPAAAREWYLRAVQNGSSHGLRSYGMMLIMGEGGDADPALGYALVELARDAGDEPAATLLDEMPEGAAERPSNRQVRRAGEAWLSEQGLAATAFQ